MQRQYLKAMVYGCLTGSLIAAASLAYVMHRSLFPNPFSQPLDWIAFPLCPIVLLGYVHMPHVMRLITLTTFEALVIVINAALYSIFFIVITSLLRKARRTRNEIEYRTTKQTGL
jgi:hypothetical protein